MNISPKLGKVQTDRPVKLESDDAVGRSKRSRMQPAVKLEMGTVLHCFFAVYLFLIKSANMRNAKQK